jgi:hypothetical protein
MSPYEIMHPGGSVDHNNEEAGSVWLNRITSHFDNCVWINPLEKGHWEMSSSVQITQDLMDDRMYTLTVGGIKEAIKNLMVKKLKSKKIK